MAAAELLINLLNQYQQKGQKSIYVDDAARGILRAFYQRAVGKNTPAGGGRAAASQDLAEQPQAVSKGEKVSLSQPDEVVAQKPAELAAIQLVSNDAKGMLNELWQHSKSWRPLLALKSVRNRHVFASGRPDADIMFVGEAPGYEEEQKGKPFVGPAGQKLEAILKAMNLSRDEVYLTNVLKFRPMLPNQTLNNRKPNEAEVRAAMPILLGEIDAVKPKCIVALGATASAIFSGENIAVDEQRGKFIDWNGTPVRVTYHPSYLLHTEDTAEKRKVWEDMLAVMERCGMEVTDRQRGFFLKKK